MAAEQGEGEGSSGKVWERREDEPGYWYERFKLYLELGAGRTLKQAFRRFKRIETGPVNVDHGWLAAAKRWNWAGRADAWDLEQRELLGLSEYNVKLAARGKRVAWLEEWVEQLREGLHTADIANMSQAEARQHLGIIAKGLDAAVAALHKEYATDLGEEAGGGLIITADDLREAQRELERRMGMRVPPAAESAAGVVAAMAPKIGQEMQPEQADEKRRSEAACYPTGKPRGRGVLSWQRRVARRTVVICYGTCDEDPFDFDVLRAPGLGYMRVLEVTSRKFGATMRREHALGRTIELLHIELPTSADGIEFTNAARDGEWMARHLTGVRVLVLARHAGMEAAEWFGTVEAVVTIGEGIDAGAVRTFLTRFWEAVGQGQLAAAAVEQGVAACPEGTAAYVRRYIQASVEE